MGDVIALRPASMTLAPQPSKAGFRIGERVRDRRYDRAGTVTGIGQLVGMSAPAIYTVRWDGARVADTVAAVNVAAEAPRLPGPELARLPGARILRRDADGQAVWSRGEDPTPPSAA